MCWYAPLPTANQFTHLPKECYHFKHLQDLKKRIWPPFSFLEETYNQEHQFKCPVTTSSNTNSQQTKLTEFSCHVGNRESTLSYCVSECLSVCLCVCSQTELSPSSGQTKRYSSESISPQHVPCFPHYAPHRGIFSGN